jgi:carboxypeptidase Q
MRKLSMIVVATALIAALLSVQAQERVAQDVYWKIRQEATDHSQIMRTLHVLTDLYGPRLTGSPNVKAAGEWAVEQMGAWGLKNGHLEPWDFGHPGWLNERLSAHIVSPVKDALVVEALGWTPGTNGPVRAAAVQVTVPERPTQEELTAYFGKIKDAVKGKMALFGPPQRVLVTLNAAPPRLEDSDLLRRFDPDLVPPAAGRGGGPQGPGGRGQQQGPQRRILTPTQVNDQFNQFLIDNGVPVRINDAGMDGGEIRAFQNANYDVSKRTPTVMMRNEDYGRIWRLLDDGRQVELEFDIVNHTYPEGTTSYNTIAEIPGTDKAGEVVMLGGHLDSWHAATGATDNAIGCAVMMEAVRILSALNLKPRRTIRIALWSGEEQGLLGSQAYVKEHFGTFEDAKPEFARLAAYFNLDHGTGQARAMTVFGPPAAADILREAIAPLKDLGALGATSTRTRQRGGSDYGSFYVAGLPGINIEQDPIQYNSVSWHTNLDTYERVIEGDAVKSAIVVAAAVYDLAMRDDLPPRFTKDQMPQAPRERQDQGN